MEAALLVVSEPLTANALAPDHETRLLTRAIAARRRHSGSMRPAPITAAVNTMVSRANATFLYSLAYLDK